MGTSSFELKSFERCWKPRPPVRCSPSSVDAGKRDPVLFGVPVARKTSLQALQTPYTTLRLLRLCTSLTPKKDTSNQMDPKRLAHRLAKGFSCLERQNRGRPRTSHFKASSLVAHTRLLEGWRKGWRRATNGSPTRHVVTNKERKAHHRLSRAL